MSIGHEEIENRFGAHGATIEGLSLWVPRHTDLRETFISFAILLDEKLRDGRAKSLAFTELEVAFMWAHKALTQEAALTKKSKTYEVTNVTELFPPLDHIRPSKENSDADV
jgi:hypothetical protein